MIVPENVVRPWYVKGHPIYNNFAYIFDNPLWHKRIPAGFSVCPYFWMSILVGAILMRLIVVPIGRLLRPIVRLVGSSLGGGLLQLDSAVIRLLGLHGTKMGAGILLMLLLPIVVVLVLGAFGFVGWKIYEFYVGVFTYSSWLERAALLYATGGLAMLCLTSGYKNKYEHKPNICNVGVYQKLFLLITAVALVSIYYAPLWGILMYLGAGLLKGALGLLVILWLALKYTVIYLGYIILWTLAITLPLAGIMWLVGWIMNRIPIAGPPESYSYVPGASGAPPVRSIGSVSIWHSNLLKALASAVIREHGSDLRYSVTGWVRTTGINEFRKHWKFGDADPDRDDVFEAVKPLLAEYIIAHMSPRLVDALKEASIIDIAAAGFALMRDKRATSTILFDELGLSHSFIQTEWIEYDALNRALNAEPTIINNYFAPIFLDKIMPELVRLEQKRLDGVAAEARKSEARKRADAKCKQVTDSIAAFFKKIGKGFKTVGKFFWQVFCWIWVVLRSKKHKWCPYFVFEDTTPKQ